MHGSAMYYHYICGGNFVKPGLWEAKVFPFKAKTPPTFPTRLKGEHFCC